VNEPESESSPSTRAKILETAESLFARFGFAGVGMRAVAESVGVSKSALFHHFPTKRALWAAVLERSMLEFDARLSAADDRAGGALERMRLWIEAVIDSLAENPSRAPLLLRSLFEVEDEEPVDAAAREVLQRVLGKVAAGLEAGIAAGEIRRVSVPHTLQSLIGLTVFHFASGDFGEDLLGAPLYSAAEIRRRKDHVIDRGSDRLCRVIENNLPEDADCEASVVNSLAAHAETLNAKFQAPERVVPIDALSLEESIGKMTETRTRILAPLDELCKYDVSTMLYPHPALGPINAYQWLLVMGGHEARHRRQINRLKEDMNYPAN